MSTLRTAQIVLFGFRVRIFFEHLEVELSATASVELLRALLERSEACVGSGPWLIHTTPCNQIRLKREIHGGLERHGRFEVENDPQDISQMLEKIVDRISRYLEDAKDKLRQATERQEQTC